MRLQRRRDFDAPRERSGRVDECRKDVRGLVVFRSEESQLSHAR